MSTSEAFMDTRHCLWSKLFSGEKSWADTDSRAQQMPPLRVSPEEDPDTINHVAVSSGQHRPWLNRNKLTRIRWPMAGMTQPGFQQGVVRNTLRCIPAKENRSESIAADVFFHLVLKVKSSLGGGSQLTQFRAGSGEYSPWRSKLKRPGNFASSRTCTGPMQAGDTYTVDFSLQGLTPNEIEE
jgi:hypothetical protein